MVVFENDIKQGLDPLPVRQGCSGPCGCTGRCRQIIGHIDRSTYTQFLSTFISKTKFIEMNMIKAVEQGLEEREYKIYLVLNGTKVQNYILMRDISSDLSDVTIDPLLGIVLVKSFKKLQTVKQYLKDKRVYFRTKRLVSGKEEELFYDESF